MEASYKTHLMSHNRKLWMEDKMSILHASNFEWPLPMDSPKTRLRVWRESHRGRVAGSPVPSPGSGRSHRHETIPYQFFRSKILCGLFCSTRSLPEIGCEWSRGQRGTGNGYKVIGRSESMRSRTTLRYRIRTQS